MATREKNTDNAVLGNTDASDNSGGSDNNDNSKNDNKSASTGDLDEVAFVLQKGDTVKKVKVRTDIQDINYIEIVDGLKDGDQVITGPYSVVSKTMKGGMLVKVSPKGQIV